MKKYIKILSLLFYFLAVSVNAQLSTEIDATRQASDSLFGWFKSLQGHAEDLVKTADRHQLINRLKDLRKDLYDLEQDKSYFLDELSRNSLDHYQLNRAVDDFNESIRKVKEGVRSVGLDLREQYKAGGIEIEANLRRALSTRKGWVQRFKESISSGSPIDPTPHILEGREAVETLRISSIELTKLILELENE